MEDQGERSREPTPLSTKDQVSSAAFQQPPTPDFRRDDEVNAYGILPQLLARVIENGSPIWGFIVLLPNARKREKACAVYRGFGGDGGI